MSTGGPASGGAENLQRGSTIHRSESCRVVKFDIVLDGLRAGMVFCAMKLLKLAVVAALAMVVTSCGPSIEMPKGTSKGYTSARLTQRNPNLPAITNATEKGIHGMIQNSISKQFSAKGLAYGAADADLVVGYLVIYQEPGMTTSYQEYFGYGRSAEELTDVAQVRGTVEGKRPDYFRQAGIVVDVIDRKTNKLVYRGFAKGDVVKGVSDFTRATRINASVAQALAGFFR